MHTNDKMDKIERVSAALGGAPVYRVPVSFFYHFPEHQRAGRAMAHAHLEYYHAADPDFLKVMNDNYYSPPHFQGLSKPADWLKLRPAPLSSQCFQDQAALDSFRTQNASDPAAQAYVARLDRLVRQANKVELAEVLIPLPS